MEEKNVKNKYGTLDDFCDKKLLDIYDIQKIFNVGYVKARKIMLAVPHFRVGKKFMCTRIALFKYTTHDRLKDIKT